jgi:hypothetical protein
MVLLIVGSTLAGAILGWSRFKFLILLPAILAGLAMTIVAGIVSSAGIWSIVLHSVIVTACLQWGYLAGLAMVSLRGGTQSRRSWTAPRKRALGGHLVKLHRADRTVGGVVKAE